MNLFCFLPRAANRLKLGVYLCAILMASSVLGLAQSSGDNGSNSGSTPRRSTIRMDTMSARGTTFRRRRLLAQISTTTIGGIFMRGLRIRIFLPDHSCCSGRIWVGGKRPQPIGLVGTGAWRVMHGCTLAPPVYSPTPTVEMVTTQIPALLDDLSQ